MWTILRSLLLAFVVCSSFSSPAVAVAPADRLLPDTTVGFLSIGSLEKLDEHWRQSQIGRLVEDEAMRPFVDDVKSQIERRTAEIRDKVGLTLADLEDVASGEVTLAVLRPGEKQAALALLADVTGREQQAEELLRKVDTNLTASGATKQTDTLGQTRLAIYTLPPNERRPREATVVVFLHDKVLCATDDRGTAEGIVARFADGAQDRLADVAAYQQTMKRCEAAAGDLAADFRWFVEPFGFTFAMRDMQARRPRSRQTIRRKDVAEVLQRQGFDAIKGVGGYVNLQADRGIELLHRTAVYAPADGKASSDVAMRLLKFPVAGDLLPPTWVQHDVATYISLNWDIQSAFDSLGPLVDEFKNEGTFEAALEGIAKDQYGPKVDIRNEIIAHLGQRISIITDYELPITPQSERFVVAVESTNDELLADAVRRLMEPDKWMRRREFEGYVLWETVEEPIDDPFNIQIQEGDFEIEPLLQPAVAATEPPPKFPHSAVGVANGHLWIASHIDYLKGVLDGVPAPQQLSQAVDFARIKTTIGALAPESLTLRSFSRTHQEYRPTFELLRKGMMPQSETLLGRVLNELLAEEDEELRPQKIDASKLPPFDEVEQYFGPAGLIIAPEADGWFIVGAILSNDGPELASRPQE